MHWAFEHKYTNTSTIYHELLVFGATKTFTGLGGHAAEVLDARSSAASLVTISCS
jgi:hypothetical protein